jgi:hypothetical protein
MATFYCHPCGNYIDNDYNPGSESLVNGDYICEDCFADEEENLLTPEPTHGTIVLRTEENDMKQDIDIEYAKAAENESADDRQMRHAFLDGVPAVLRHTGQNLTETKGRYHAERGLFVFNQDDGWGMYMTSLATADSKEYILVIGTNIIGEVIVTKEEV